jgi:hypothetical protein
MSPTDFHLIAEAQANNSLLMGGMASPSSPMMLFQRDLNHNLANLEHKGEEEAAMPAIAQAAAKADPASAAAAAEAKSLDESENIAEQYLDRSTRGAAQFNQDEDHYEGDDENTTTIQGSSSNRKSNVKTRKVHSLSSRKYKQANSNNLNFCTHIISSLLSKHIHTHTDGKRVSFSDTVIVTLSPATPLFPPTPVPDRPQQDDGNSFDGSLRSSDDHGWNKDGEEEGEEDDMCLDHDAGIDEHDLSVSKKNLVNDIAEEEEEEEEDDDDDEEGENDREAGVGVKLRWDVQAKEQEIEGVKKRNFATRAGFLLVISIIVLFMTGVVSFFPKQGSASIAPLHEEQKPTVAQVLLVPRGGKEFSQPKNEDIPTPVDPAAPGAKAPNVITRIVMNRATLASSPNISPKQRHWPFREQQKWLEAEDLSAIAGIESRFEPRSPSVPMREDAQPTPQKSVWHHVRDAIQRFINFRMLGVFLGYILLFSFLF